MAAAAVLLLAVAGGGAWWALRGGAAPEPVAEVVELPPLASRELVVGYEPVAPVSPGITFAELLAPAGPAAAPRTAAAARSQAASPSVRAAPPVAQLPPLEHVDVIGRASKVAKTVPTAAPLPPLRFTKVKLVRGNGDVDAQLELGGDRLVVLNANGSRSLAEVSYSAITSALFTESKHTRLVVQTRRYWLTVTTASGETKLRLDKDNHQSILESFKQRSGKGVAVGEERE